MFLWMLSQCYFFLFEMSQQVEDSAVEEKREAGLELTDLQSQKATIDEIVDAGFSIDDV